MGLRHQCETTSSLGPVTHLKVWRTSTPTACFGHSSNSLCSLVSSCSTHTYTHTHTHIHTHTLMNGYGPTPKKTIVCVVFSVLPFAHLQEVCTLRGRWWDRWETKLMNKCYGSQTKLTFKALESCRTHPGASTVGQEKHRCSPDPCCFVYIITGKVYSWLMAL
jgi:hypothetical protein